MHPEGLKDYMPQGDVYTMKSRKTTQEERIKIVRYCLEHEKDYKQITVPASVPLKEFEYNAEVELINPVVDTVANANYLGADVDWYIKADDIILKIKSE